MNFRLHQSFKVLHRFRERINLCFPFFYLLSFLRLNFGRSLRRVIGSRTLLDELVSSRFSESSFLLSLVQFGLSIDDTLYR